MDTELRLRRYLSDGEWHTWREIEEHTGITRDAARSTELFYSGLIGDGRNGMKLAALASRDELNHAINALHSRAIEITARAAALGAHLT